MRPQVVAVQQTPAMPSSCLFVESPSVGATSGDEGAGSAAGAAAGSLFLHVGASHAAHNWHRYHPISLPVRLAIPTGLCLQ